MKHKVARFMHSHADVVADFSTPMQAPVMYCGPSAHEHESRISAETCKSQLGERTFNILRQAMLQQQETFIEQLWDLHRLTRTQHRRAALLPAEPVVLQQQVEPAVSVFSRNRQEQIRSQTMHAISQLPMIPSSLRRSFVASTAAQEDTCEQEPPCTADRVRVSPGALKPCVPGNTGPLFAAGLNGPYQHLPASAPTSFAFADGATGSPYTWASGGPHIAGSAFSTTLAMHGQPPVCANPNTQYLAGVFAEPVQMFVLLTS